MLVLFFVDTQLSYNGRTALVCGRKSGLVVNINMIKLDNVQTMGVSVKIWRLINENTSLMFCCCSFLSSTYQKLEMFCFLDLPHPPPFHNTNVFYKALSWDFIDWKHVELKRPTAEQARILGGTLSQKIQNITANQCAIYCKY